MHQELSARVEKVGMKINVCEMRVMQSCDLLKANSVIDGVGLDEVDSYISLG